MTSSIRFTITEHLGNFQKPTWVSNLHFAGDKYGGESSSQSMFFDEIENGSISEFVCFQPSDQGFESSPEQNSFSIKTWR